MDGITVVMSVVFIATMLMKALSTAYFEVAFSTANHLFPDGSLKTGGAEIPNQNVATFFFPKWLHSGGSWANRLQYVLAIPVGLKFGWPSVARGSSAAAPC